MLSTNTICTHKTQTANIRSTSLYGMRKQVAVLALGLGTFASLCGPAWAEEGPDALIKKISDDMVTTIKTDKAIAGGDQNKIASYVDAKIMPHVNFARMTSTVVGRGWKQATPEQQQQLQSEYKKLLVKTYSGALSQFKNETVEMQPFRGNAAVDKEVVVRTKIVGRPSPIQLDYRLEKTDAGWRIYDANVAGVWMNDSYKNQFATVIRDKGIDGLITTLSERNKVASIKP